MSRSFLSPSSLSHSPSVPFSVDVFGARSPSTLCFRPCCVLARNFFGVAAAVCCFFVLFVCLLLCLVASGSASTQVRSLAHEVSFRLPVDAFKGGHDSSHHGGVLGTYAGICVGDPEVGDVTISEMSPEDIRAELKR